MARRKRSSSACKATTVRFKTKRGKTISFKGHAGDGCGPRPKPSTAHLRQYKLAMKTAARHCKGRSRGAFLNCVSTQLPK